MDVNEQLSRLRRGYERFERLVPWLALGAAPIGLILVLRSQRDAVDAINGAVSWQTLAVSAAAFAAAPLLQAVSFWLALRMFTGTTPFLETLVVWARSYVLRYAPTGALAVAYRLAARHRLHASADQLLAAFAYEHVSGLGAAALVCLVLFGIAGDLPPLLPLAIAVAATCLVAALQPGFAGRMVEAASRRLGLHLSVVLGRRQLAALLGVNAVGWIGTGLAVYVVVGGVSDGSGTLRWIVASYAAGYLVGFVAPLAPGGIGVREGALVLILGPRYGTSIAIAAALATRVANVAGELVAVTLVHVTALGRATAEGALSALRAVRAPGALQG